MRDQGGGKDTDYSPRSQIYKWVLLSFLLCVIANNSRFIVRKKREEMANTLSPQGDSLGNKALEETRKAMLKGKQTNINQNGGQVPL